MPQNIVLTPDELNIFRSVPDLYLILSPDLHILTASDAYLAATISSRNEIIGKHVFEAFPQNPATPQVNSVGSLNASLQQVISSGKPHQMEMQRYDVRRPAKLGGGFEEKYWHPLNTPVLDEEGRVKYIIHKVSDVTHEVRYQYQIESLTAAHQEIIEANKLLQLSQQEMKIQNEQLESGVAIRRKELQSAQAETEQQRARLEAILLQAPVAIGIYNGPEHTVELVNPHYCALTGRPAKALVGKPILEIFPEVIEQGFDAILSEVFHTGRPFYTPEAAITIVRDGKLVQGYYSITCHPLRNAEQQITGIIHIATEVSEQVEIRQRLQENKEKYQSLFESMDQGFCVIEMVFDELNKPFDYYFLEVNPTFEQQTGLKDSVGKSARELVPDLEKRWFELYGIVAQTGESIRFIEGSDAMGRWFEVFAYRLGDSKSRKVALLFTDITKRKKTEQSLLQKNDELKKINSDLDNFIYTASHDLRAPIINIEGLIGVLYKSFSEESKSDVKTKALMDMIYRSIDSFKNTIKDLTEVAKVKSNGEDDLAEVSFAEILEDVKINIKGLIDESNATIIDDFSAAPLIHFSKKNLRSIIYNLVSNAIKYRSPNRPVVINITTAKQINKKLLLLRVEDNGLGINKQDLPKVFKMFTRLHLHVEGTGVGMSIVKRIVENNGGKIEIDSEVDRGSIFKIYLND